MVSYSMYTMSGSSGLAKRRTVNEPPAAGSVLRRGWRARSAVRAVAVAGDGAAVGTDKVGPAGCVAAFGWFGAWEVVACGWLGAGSWVLWYLQKLVAHAPALRSSRGTCRTPRRQRVPRVIPVACSGSRGPALPTTRPRAPTLESRR